MIKKITYFIALGICLFIINDLVHSIYDLWQKQNVISQTNQELEAKQQENNKIKSELAQAQTNAFIDQEARDKLFLIKPGEQEVVIPATLLPKATQPQAKQQIPNWQQWVDVFFHN